MQPWATWICLRVSTPIVTSGSCGGGGPSYDRSFLDGSTSTVARGVHRHRDVAGVDSAQRVRVLAGHTANAGRAWRNLCHRAPMSAARSDHRPSVRVSFVPAPHPTVPWSRIAQRCIKIRDGSHRPRSGIRQLPTWRAGPRVWTSLGTMAGGRLHVYRGPDDEEKCECSGGDPHRGP
jgi:hypothetical protein